MALTGKKQAFGKASWAGKSNRDAAVIAGYSEKTASAAGSRLAKDPDVKAYLAEMKKRAAARPKKTTPPAKSTAPAAGPDIPDDDLLESDTDPREFLRKAMLNGALEPRQRLDAAKALLPYEHQKLGEGGKKERKQDAAKNVAKGRFGARAAPKLVHSK